jgi:hypothetical protein
MKLINAILFLAVFAANYVASAAEATITNENHMNLHRMAKTSAVSMTLNKPAPALLGLNYAYSMSPLLKVEIGYGDVAAIGASGSAIGAGVTVSHPDWNFTPTFGLNFSSVSIQGNPTISFNGINKSGAYVYSSLGFDYQSEGGFNLSMGLNLPFGGGMTSSVFISTGWAFEGLKL